MAVLKMDRFQQFVITSLLLGGWTLNQAQSAIAGAFSVLPIKVYLNNQTRSEQLTVKNESNDPQRFQVTVNSWTNNERGELQLNPTQEIIAFPLLFELAPGETRTLRVGTRVPPTTQERTYRVFLQQLPTATANASTSSARGIQINLLMKVGVPIFVAPIQPVQSGQLEKLAIHQGQLSLTLKNTGNIHFFANSIPVKGYDATGKIVFQGQVSGGYILAGSQRLIEESLPQTDCATVRSIEVNIQTSEERNKPLNLTQKLDTPNGVCKP